MDDATAAEAVKQISWAGYALTHAPAFGSGGFMMGLALFLYRTVRNPRVFCCSLLGWALFAGTLLYLWISHTDPKTPSSHP